MNHVIVVKEILMSKKINVKFGTKLNQSKKLNN